jgi:PleD family two-component response regulator
MGDESKNDDLDNLRRQVETLQLELAAKELEIENLQKLRKDLEAIATHDPLTGLLNRRSWLRSVAERAPGAHRSNQLERLCRYIARVRQLPITGSNITG